MMNRRPYFVLALCQNEPPARIWMEYEDVGDTTVSGITRNWCMRVENLTGNLNVSAPENSVY